MSELERVCRNCGEAEQDTRLEQCPICARAFCSSCSHRGGSGRRFCSPQCAQAFYFSGEVDDDEDAGSDD